MGNFEAAGNEEFDKDIELFYWQEEALSDMVPTPDGPKTVREILSQLKPENKDQLAE
jgi:hypothetical protein